MVVSVIVGLLIVGAQTLSGTGLTEFSKNIQTTSMPSSVSKISDTYDMVVIAPSEFSSHLQPLIEHKNSYGIKTILKTTEDIYADYEGSDKPEQIKYFIKNAIEQWNIQYVMLVGGLNSYLFPKQKDNQNCGYTDWHVPVRYANLVEPISCQFYDPGYVTDLYYADIYDSNGNFSSWDPNNNGIFAEWNMRKGMTKDKEIIDLYPDVCVGRLACRNVREVQTVVDKIITYETGTYEQEWFRRIVVAAGDLSNDPKGYDEGVVHSDYILENYMAKFTPVKLYSAYAYDDPQHTPAPKNVIREVSAGCGFFFVAGHGSPQSMECGWPGETPMEDVRTILSVFHLFMLNNDFRLPIAFLGGCHNAQFNVSLFSGSGNFVDDFFMGRTVPECLAWWLVRKEDGGAIASISYTALGYVSFGESGDKDGDGVNDPDFVEQRHGFLFNSFFKAINDGMETLGEAWKAALSRYLDTFPAWNSWMDVKNTEACVLLGDPSLKIGGYPS